MELIFNCDHSIQGSHELIEKYQPEIEHRLKHFSDYLTRVDVFFADENGKKTGTDDKRCTIETRIKGKQAEAVTHHADNLANALHGALEKVKSMLEKRVASYKTH